ESGNGTADHRPDLGQRRPTGAVGHAARQDGVERDRQAPRRRRALPHHPEPRRRRPGRSPGPRRAGKGRLRLPGRAPAAVERGAGRGVRAGHLRREPDGRRDPGGRGPDRRRLGVGRGPVADLPTPLPLLQARAADESAGSAETLHRLRADRLVFSGVGTGHRRHRRADPVGRAGRGRSLGAGRPPGDARGRIPRRNGWRVDRPPGASGDVAKRVAGL
ncbi:MAG: Uncharacterized protein conserved in bacteria, partial [uncultured Thermomicrobiales bacterium]